ncbi:MAG: amidohydrolase family protein [Pseudonocardia sp.]|uniref:amidohydrolase family protein n=1 Tax=unclassified Pseudonocardia TaxID=2619320 RepID=UPI000868360B|nr:MULTISPECIES: amidohydrolase family protein [unclassified Pseudonocardia]MBN9112356.1 amidohydrolase family protein [Pseudonocardia sp.]ODU28255.1 MAG: amidohydrolase [Pseudonocardia sp. SCN 72-51]ODV08982.1 MAG: amidohydrolase [Pseudonocardia sp. SCN 73-27]
MSDPAGPRRVVDAHHHLLDVAGVGYGWIRERSPVLQALLANYYDIARDYGPADHAGDMAGTRLDGSVACEFGADDPVAEATWVQSLADAGNGPDAFIAAADPSDPGLAERLRHYRDLPVVRAVRQPLYWADDPLRRLGARPDCLTDPRWLTGFEQIAAAGLTWDLLVYDAQIPDATELLRSFPDTPIVLEAACWPLDLSPDGFSRWVDHLEFAAAHPNVALKLQGLALLFGPSREATEPWVRRAVATFGAQRCMFATHLPVDGLLWSVDDLVGTLAAVLADLTAAERAAFFTGCARRQYGLPAG